MFESREKDSSNRTSEFFFFRILEIESKDDANNKLKIVKVDRYNAI